MSIRTRFAPAPTGLMHLGNVRTALMNYLFARKHNGTFIIRVEDTDQQRNFDPGAQQILADLYWLNLTFQEGPGVGGNYGPYFQSERTALYQEKLQELIDRNLVYRCFCTADELEKKRQRQLDLKLPPRYDRACAKLSPQEMSTKLAAHTPFIWRLKVPDHGTVTINDLARGTVQFDFKNFSDHPLTRQDGSITFVFANFVDDLMMRITHIFRGADHLTNTALQAVLYQAFSSPLPTYWHMPILCDAQGKKLSKRDFGFSLNDLRQAGYLPEAICNYLAIIGGGSFEQEVMSLDQLVNAANFNTASQIRFDVEKLSWLNHQWIERLAPEDLTSRCLPFIAQIYPQVTTLDRTLLTKLLQTIKSDLTTLRDAQQALHFYFTRPALTREQLHTALDAATVQQLAALVTQHLEELHNPQDFVQKLKDGAKQANIPIKSLFGFLRLALMGQQEGPAIVELIQMLGIAQAGSRIRDLSHIGSASE